MDSVGPKVEALRDRFAQRTIEGNYALWNALLTMNAMIITVFTAVIAYVEHSVQLLLVPTILLSVVSAGLIIANFRVSRDNMKYAGLLLLGRVFEMSDEEKATDIVAAERSHSWIVRRERAVEFITFIQGVLVVLLVLHIACSSHPIGG
jgi:hypothetical protein